MWHVYLLIPPIIATAWALFNIKGLKVRARRLVMMALIVLAMTYFGIEDYLLQTGYYPFIGAKLLHDFVATLLVPLAHLLVCYSLGITNDLRYFKFTMGLSVLMVFDLLHLICTGGSTLPSLTTKYNYLHLSIGEMWTANVQVYSVIIILQTFIEAQRIYVMRKIFVVRDLYLSRSGKGVVWFTFFVCLWIFLTMLPSHELMATTIIGTVVMVSYSILFTGYSIVLGWFFNPEIIVDSEDNKVNIERDVDSMLAEDLRLLLERDKVYLNNNLRIEDLANILSSNRTYIARAFRIKFKGTFTEVMNRYRIEHAKALMLEDPRMRMDEVASRSGFSSSSFYARVFKAAENLTPTQWRRRNLQETSADDDDVQDYDEGITTEEALEGKEVAASPRINRS